MPDDMRSNVNEHKPKGSDSRLSLDGLSGVKLYLAIGWTVIFFGGLITLFVYMSVSGRRQNAREAIVADERYALLSESGEYSVSRTSKELARVPEAGALGRSTLNLKAENASKYMVIGSFELLLSVDLVRHEFTPLLDFKTYFISLHSDDPPLIRKLTGLTPEGEYFFGVPFDENTSLIEDDALKYYMSLFERNELVARLLRGEEVQLRLYTDEGDWNLSIQYDDMNTIAEWQRMIDWVRSLGYESRWLSKYESEGGREVGRRSRRSLPIGRQAIILLLLLILTIFSLAVARDAKNARDKVWTFAISMLAVPLLIAVAILGFGILFLIPFLVTIWLGWSLESGVFVIAPPLLAFGLLLWVLKPITERIDSWRMQRNRDRSIRIKGIADLAVADVADKAQEGGDDFDGVLDCDENEIVSCSCPNCGSNVRVPRKHLGKRGRCSHCDEIFEAVLHE